jgi:transcriptional regulator of acetoin/glycerol metabolism
MTTQDVEEHRLETVAVYTAEGHIRKLRDIQGDVIRLAMVHYRGNCTIVAEQLGIGRGTLYRKMKELGIMPIPPALPAITGTSGRSPH